MPRSQTVLSELIVALGILALDFSDLSNFEKIENVDESTVNQCKWEIDALETKGQIEKLNLLYESGSKIRKWLINNRMLTSFGVKWTGKNKTLIPEQASVDLIVTPNNLRVSVKENSAVVWNVSPIQAFEFMPKGNFQSSHLTVNWFEKVAYQEFNSYYKICLELCEVAGYRNIYDYLKKSKLDERKHFAKKVAELHSIKNHAVLYAYGKLCDKVSEASAALFNEQIDSVLKGSQSKESMLANISKLFLRIDSTEYILSGYRDKQSFALISLPSSEWFKQYKALSIKAFPSFKSQPEIRIAFEFLEQKTNRLFTITLRAEIRWSHGKFNGSPECKIYLDANQQSLPWMVPLNIGLIY